MFCLTVHRFLARALSPTCTTYGNFLLGSIMAVLTPKSGTEAVVSMEYVIKFSSFICVTILALIIRAIFIKSKISMGNILLFEFWMSTSVSKTSSRVKLVLFSEVKLKISSLLQWKVDEYALEFDFYWLILRRTLTRHNYRYSYWGLHLQ